MRILLITLLFVSSAFAGPFEDNYDKTGDGTLPSKYYDDVRDNDGNYNELLNNYDNAPLGDIDTSDVPKDAVENDPGQSARGYGTGASLSGKVSNEDSLLSILRSIKSGGELTTLGDTYVCNFDNVTYSDYGDCQKSCQTVCTEYKFNVEFGCQYPIEVVRVSVPDSQKMNAAPMFNLWLKQGVSRFTTPRATAICVNGMKSGDDYYTWDIQGDKIGLAIPRNRADVGECYDMTKKPFFAHYQEYYRYMGYSIQSYLSRLGYVASHSIDSSTDLVFSAIVSGACAEGVLMTGIPNAAEVEMVRQGKMPSNIRDIADKNDMYKMVTENTDYSAYSCSVTNGVTLVSELVQTVTEQVFTGALPDITKKDKGSTSAFNNGTTIGIQQSKGSIYTEDFLDRLEGRYISSSLVLGSYTNSNGTLWDSPYGTGGLVPNETRLLENRWINSPVPYTFTITIEKSETKERFEVAESNTCSVPDDCKLENEYVCDINGNNCVQTVKGGNRKGEKVPRMCTEISTTQDKYLVCADGATISAIGTKQTFSDSAGYFTTKKEYKCSTPKEKKDYSAFLAQSKLISESATVAPNGDYTFKSIGLDGKQSDFTTNITLKDTQCIQTCKVKVPANQDNKTVVLPSGTTGTPPPVLSTPYYKPCIYEAEDDDWKCILDGNETLVAGGACACPNDFVDIIVNLKFIDEAASGMVCSDKKVKP